MKAICFDLDGVLVDSRDPIAEGLNVALRSHGFAERPVEELHGWIGPPLMQTFEGLVPGASAQLVGELVDAYRSHYRTIFDTKTPAVEGIEPVLASLSSRVPLAVATSKPFAFADPLLVALGLRRYFEFVSGPEFDARRESKAETLARALSALGVAGADAVHVGDTRFDVEGAAACGARCIGVTWGIGTREELAEADAIVDSPADLVAALGL